MKIKFHLVKPARKSGGDKYESSEGVSMTIYIPQTISRPKGAPVQTFEVTFERKS